LNLNKKKNSLKLKKTNLYFIFFNLFFYKNNSYKNNFYKNIYLLYNFYNLSSNDLKFNPFLFNFSFLNNINKLNSTQFWSIFDLFIKHNFTNLESNSIEINDDFKDGFDDLFLKKSKFFFFKNSNTFNRNSIVNLISFYKFSDYFSEKYFINDYSSNNFSSINYNNSCLYFYFFKPFFFKSFNNILVFKNLKHLQILNFKLKLISFVKVKKSNFKFDNFIKKSSF